MGSKGSVWSSEEPNDSSDILSLSRSLPADTKPVPDAPVLDRPCCRAVYSFQPSHDGELRFSEGDVIVLTGRVDAHWYEGAVGGRSGLLPANYVDVLVPLPWRRLIATRLTPDDMQVLFIQLLYKII